MTCFLLVIGETKITGVTENTSDNCCNIIKADNVHHGHMLIKANILCFKRNETLNR